MQSDIKPKERPILLNAEMVRAVLDGRKTQTRRIIQSPAKNMQANGRKVIDYREPGDKWYGEHVFSMRNQSGTWCDYTKEQFLAKCPFGAVGDRLWVREKTRVDLLLSNRRAHVRYEADGAYQIVPIPERIKPMEDGRCMSNGCYREASRITLEITGVRVERLNSLTESDALAEGCNGGHNSIPGYMYSATPHEHFHHIWESIYGAESWQANPWVWVIEFKRVEGE